MKINVRKLDDGVKLPIYATEDSAGMDIFANFKENEDIKYFEGSGYIRKTDKTLVVSPGARFTIPTGLIFEIPKGYEGQNRSRSGLSLKQGLMVVQGVGTIDADYRGELKVCLVNLSEKYQEIPYNSRISQFIIKPVPMVELNVVEELSETTRGDGGFGHTGLK